MKKLIIAGKEFNSCLFLGTGKQPRRKKPIQHGVREKKSNRNNKNKRTERKKKC